MTVTSAQRRNMLGRLRGIGDRSRVGHCQHRGETAARRGQGRVEHRVPVAVDRRPAGDQAGAVERLVLVEAGAVDGAGDQPIVVQINAGGTIFSSRLEDTAPGIWIL